MTATAAWDADFVTLVDRLGLRFARAEARGHAADYLRGLLGRAERKNGWQLAEAVGTPPPTGSSSSSIAPPGTPTRCATTCGPRSSTSWATRRACWWSMRPGS